VKQKIKVSKITKGIVSAEAVELEHDSCYKLKPGDTIEIKTYPKFEVKEESQRFIIDLEELLTLLPEKQAFQVVGV
jgi:hypothetical protein